MKKKRLLIVAIAAVLGGVYLSGSPGISPWYTIRTEIALPASPEQSWEVLTDFARYAQWNPYLPRVEGRLAEGQTVSFTLVDANFPEPIDLTARLGEVTPNKQFYWSGRLGVQGLFDTRHVFELRLREDGHTDLHHYEEFRGIIPALLPNREERTANTRQSFQRMNTALYQRLSANAD